MDFRWSEVKKPAFILAPLADITTLPFRSICKEFGADIVFTPMFSANAIIHNPKKTLDQIRFLPEEQPLIVQLFGYDGDIIAEAANIVQKELNPAGIDINMGCPAPKITGNECGSALLKDYDKALELVSKVRDQYKGQLSVKVRLGWKDKDVLPFILKLEQIGINAITIHGRTTKQGYSGEADWETIDETASKVMIPVIGNGDITTWQKAWERAANPKLTGVMIGRGCLGRPWIFREIKEKKDTALTTAQITEVITRQAQLTVDFVGDEEHAMRMMRKHLGWYIQGFSGAKELRKQAMQINCFDDLKIVLDMIKL